MGQQRWSSYSPEAYLSLFFAPGAVCDTAVSTSARTFLPTRGGQSLLVDLIAHGLTGGKGYTDEPLLQAIASPPSFLTATPRVSPGGELLCRLPFRLLGRRGHWRPTLQSLVWKRKGRGAGAADQFYLGNPTAWARMIRYYSLKLHRGGPAAGVQFINEGRQSG